MKVMPMLEHAARVATRNWSTPVAGFPAWSYPAAPRLPAKPLTTQPGRQWKAMNGHLFSVDLVDLELVTR